jgi:MGT family glycosyltransferase
VRQDKPYEVPTFAANADKPLLYVSFGSLGSGDTATLKRLIEALEAMPVRALVNIGGYGESYGPPPPNIVLDSWFPQPSVIPQVDAVIHHGGNNTFTECLYFGKPAIVMPYVWDGHDNAQRVDETGHGIKMHRADWTVEELAANIQRLLTDTAMASRLKEASRAMQSAHGPSTAARRLDDLLMESRS